jgi:hypothetical protein
MFWSQISREHCGWIWSRYWKILSLMTLQIIIIIIINSRKQCSENECRWFAIKVKLKQFNMMTESQWAA